ncbi:MAG: esterase family protein [Acidobacteriia bacterium]|nr:esterase family protein [Terriglobia bacterium]
MRKLPLLFLAATLCLAESPMIANLAKLAKTDPAAFRKELTDEALKQGTANRGEGPDFLFAVESASQPGLFLNDEPGPKMQRGKEAGVWFARETLTVRRTHNFHYIIDGKSFGGATDVMAFGPDSYLRPGVPEGKLDGKHVHASKLYPGMLSDYWVYVPAQYDPKTPAAVMVWQDGEVLVPRESSRNQIVFDNLTHEKKIPVIIYVLISPGLTDGQRMRSIEYDTMDDRYPRFLRDEVLPEVGKKYNLRQDGYSRAIAGDSSGGICAFNAAYMHPELFTRVLSRIGSFTSIQWKPGVLDGGNVYPFKIRKDSKKNIRVWLQDGSGDLENNNGSWPMQNIAMANSLKMEEYDFHFTWGNGTHSRNGGHVELAEEMIWLWRDYDPAKSSQEFVMDPAEKEKPYFRVNALNR